MRQNWLEAMLKIVDPIFSALEKEELKEKLPGEFHPDRTQYAYLEGVGRSLTGIAPWLELEGLTGEEAKLQATYRQKVIKGLTHCVDPNSKDYLDFACGYQSLVDAAFFAHGLVRAPKHLLAPLSDKTKEELLFELKKTRKIMPVKSNWVFFSAMVEGAIYLIDEKEVDLLRVLSAMRLFEEWYHGDGFYGDGPAFALDYYNSYVIQPMYLDLVELFGNCHHEIKEYQENVLKRSQRYGTILERMISPEGTFPIIGRSITYRFGNFQLLGQLAQKEVLPTALTPAQVRCGMDAVLNKTLSGKIFDEKGWLVPGIMGEQEELAESYISIGSLYMCVAFFLPLGLLPTNDFWQSPDEDWTNKKVWSGEKSAIDHAF